MISRMVAKTYLRLELYDIGTEGNNTLTYSAPSDLAGNEGQNITRNVIVLDLPPISIMQARATHE